MSELYDPLGLVNPVIVLAKIFMQQLWELKIDWDTPLPEELRQKWIMYRSQLPLLKSLKLPRRVRTFENTTSIELHGFADASELAYGACIYVKTTSKGNNVAVFLLCAKSRVAPSKKKTIARLELCAAQLLGNLMAQVKRALKFTVHNTYFWTDSTIVLQWIASTPTKYTTFVANRVACIQAATKEGVWQHVRSEENPADIVSRGMLPSRLLSTRLWFEGPTFLRHPIRIQPIPTESKLPELRKTKYVLLAEFRESSIIHKIRHNNNFQRLQDVTALIMRFANNCRVKAEERTEGRLKPVELERALHLIVREMQGQDFKHELKKLKNEETVPSDSRLKALAPFLDENNIIRVGGRIAQSNLPFNSKHAMLISSANPISKLIFNHLHIKYLHAGPQTLLYISRQTFWCINGKSLANTTVRQCIRCARTKPQLLTQVMGNLPAERVQQSRPFLHVGVDFCGPIQIHIKVRGKRPIKSYIAVFVCFSTKAIHLELVADLTAAAFIGSLKRFIARRGCPSKIFCDNATNFTGAQSELRELAAVFHQKEGQDILQAACIEEGIEWLHIPPRSPHFGGLWESAVKSAKYHLKRIVDCASLTYEELNTVICQVEAILNSRPLTPLSNDPNDLQALSPGHFLIGQPLNTIPEPEIATSSLPLLTRWKAVRALQNEFWRRWSKEFLQELQNRYKWQKPLPNIEIGTLVLLKDDNLPPLKWRMGRIVSTMQGKDNKVRVVNVKTATGELRRAIQTIAVLPCEVDNPESHQEDPIIINQATNSKPKIAPVSYLTLSPTSTTSTTKRKSEVIGERQVPSTPQKKAKASLFTTLLCLLLVLPVSQQFGNEGTDPLQITKFNHNPGIFLEEVGRVKLTHNTWKIITYYDLTGYWTEYDGLSKHILNMVQLCAIQGKLLNVTQYCNTVVLQFQHLQLEVQQRNDLLYQHHVQSRRKRAPLNVIGSTAHLLFGILDEDFAKQYEEDISKVKNNENYLLNLLKNQTSIVEGALHFFKRNTEEIQHQFKFIQSQIEQLTTTTRKLEEVTQIFSSIALQTSLLLMHLQNTQNVLLQMMTNTYHGRINPLLLNADQLRSQIQLMREHLPSDQTIPISSTSLLNLYSVATINARTTRKNLIFDISNVKQGQVLPSFGI